MNSENDRPRFRASPVSLLCGSWARHIYPTLVLVQPRKTSPCLTERLLMGRKESNQTKQNFEFNSYGLFYPVCFIIHALDCPWFIFIVITQVNRMSRSRRVLAIGGKQRILRLDMVCNETILFHLDSPWGIRTTYRSIVYRMMITLKTIDLFELNLFEFKSHLNSEMQ